MSLLPFPYPHIYVVNNANQSIPNNTLTDILLNATVFRNGGIVLNSSNEVFTPYTGIHFVTVGCRFTANATGDRKLAVKVNGTKTFEQNFDAPAAVFTNHDCHQTFICRLISGDLLKLSVLQTSGAANINLAVTDLLPYMYVIYLYGN
jgi:hypothetical protein